MHPVLVDFGTVEIGSFTLRLAIGSYGLAFAVALVAGWLLILHLGKQIDPGAAWTDLYFTAAIGGFLGAKVLNVLTRLPEIIEGELTLAGAFRGGGVWLGGIIAGISIWFWRVRKIDAPAGLIANAFFVMMPMAHAIGRIGCFFGGCCYGGRCEKPWAVIYTDETAHALNGTPLGIPLHPTVLYEASLEFLNFAVAYWLWRRGMTDWLIWAGWMGVYGAQRFFLEYFRADYRGGAGGLSTSQWISLGFVGLAVGLYLTLGRRGLFQNAARA